MERTFVTPLGSENDANALLRRRYAHCAVRWLVRLGERQGGTGD